jgi:two-component system LytT family sensor kinase
LTETALHTTQVAGSFATAGLRNTGLLKKRWLYHPLFWLLYYGLTIVLYLSIKEPLSTLSYVMTAYMIAVEAAFAYMNLYFLIPRLLFTKKYFYYGPALFLANLTCSVLVLLSERGVDSLIPGKTLPKFSIQSISIGFIQGVYTLGLTTGLKFVKDSILNQQKQEEKEKQYLETELKFLKSQIQPHFFFNTLNNIYSLTLKKSDQAPEVILRLSDLMSYMLYDSTAALVPLGSEIGYLRNYLEIEQLRFGQRLTVSFTIEGRMEEARIPPMILILFLENSFKHGVKNNISHILLTVSLKVADGSLHFRVENPVSEEESHGENNGIGLKNVRRRLDLLFGEAYTLDTREQERKYIVSLNMPLC